MDSKKLDKSKVLVMNLMTWEDIKNQTVENAFQSSSPMSHIERFQGMEIIVDNELPDGYVEVFEKWMYEEVLKYGKKEE